MRAGTHVAEKVLAGNLGPNARQILAGATKHLKAVAPLFAVRGTGPNKRPRQTSNAQSGQGGDFQ